MCCRTGAPEPEPRTALDPSLRRSDCVPGAPGTRRRAEAAAKGRSLPGLESGAAAHRLGEAPTRGPSPLGLDRLVERLEGAGPPARRDGAGQRRKLASLRARLAGPGAALELHVPALVARPGTRILPLPLRGPASHHIEVHVAHPLGGRRCLCQQLHAHRPPAHLVVPRELQRDVLGVEACALDARAPVQGFIEIVDVRGLSPQGPVRLHRIERRCVGLVVVRGLEESIPSPVL
mmetsp:Transcript_92778/g.248790  ORF Transcript_92778/g.248790 Transcript_92778/m.248790 type:complete len:234 (+) Transcript_92778:1-702(+)